MITTRGKLVFVAESFPLDLARKLTALILDAQGTGEMQPGAGRAAAAPRISRLRDPGAADRQPGPLLLQLRRDESRGGCRPQIAELRR